MPAVFIYRDLQKLSFYPALDSEYNYSLGLKGSLHNFDGKTLDKYPVGVSLFELPFFITAHYYCKISHQYKLNGFSLPYQLAGMFSNIFWVVAGLFVLRRFLKRYFDDNVTTITIICIAFGTNLYLYSSFTTGMSHPYSFFLFSSLLLLTDTVYKNPPSTSASLGLGLVLGLIFIVRPTNIVAVIVPSLFGIKGISSLTERGQYFKRHIKLVLLALLAFFAMAFVQFAYWKSVTGHWLVYSYGDEGFDFLHPKILKGLFSYRKGWFVYTPMSAVGLAGVFYLWKKDKSFVPALVIYFLVTIYLVFSWREWWYGGSFGCRALIESLAFLAMPIAAMTEYFIITAGKVKRAVFLSIIILVISLNIFQTYQYSMGLIHWSDMTKEYYWRVFGKTEFDRDANKKYLLKPSGAADDLD